MSFFVGSAARRAASPILIAMLGRSEFALRRGFAQRQNARTPQRRRGPEGPFCGFRRLLDSFPFF